MKKLGIYVHIPFCNSKCDYCDFYSLPAQSGDVKARYAKALRAHILESVPAARSFEVDSVYFGGGTPITLGLKDLTQLFRLIAHKFRLTKNAEITVEANPDSVDLKTLKALRRAGFNRISFGMQSACDRELAAVHRPHNFAQTVQAVEDARKARFQNISLDLIYGLPGQTFASWMTTLEQAVALEPQHISGYGLKVEPSTPLWDRVARGETLMDDDQQADCYLAMVDFLREKGYKQYEISNFAQSGFRSRHNMKYWLMQPYLAFGPGAHADFGGRRYSYLRDLSAYLSGVESGGDLLDEDTPIAHAERGAEYLMLRLRTTYGIEAWEFRREFCMNFEPLEALLLQFETHGWAEQKNGRWRFTPEGFLRSNQLIGLLLERQERATLSSTLRQVEKFNKRRDGGT